MDAAVITIGKFVAGTVSNAIPERAEMEGTIRALTNEVRNQLIQRVMKIIEGIEETFNVTCDFQLYRSIPPCVNNEVRPSLLFKASVIVVGRNNVHYLPVTTGVKDF